MAGKSPLDRLLDGKNHRTKLDVFQQAMFDYQMVYRKLWLISEFPHISRIKSLQAISK